MPGAARAADHWLDCKRCGTRVSAREMPDTNDQVTRGAYMFANVLLTVVASEILLLQGAGVVFASV